MRQVIEKDFCPKSDDRVHSYFDYSYWSGKPHPQCIRCGYVDESRTLPLNSKSES